MLTQLRNPRFYGMILIEAVIFAMAYIGAHLLRFEFVLAPADVHRILRVLPFLIPAKLVIFFLLGLYRGMWRYSGVHDFWRLFEASICASLLVVALVLFAYGFAGFSRSVFFLDGALTFVMTGGLRMAIRTYYAYQGNSNGRGIFGNIFAQPCSPKRKSILIVGAGGAGEKLLREIFDNPFLHYHAVGFLDDDPTKRGRALHGIPVLGTVDALPRILERQDVDEVVISIPSATGPQIRRIMALCDHCKAPYKTLPALGQILDDKVSVKALRDVKYEDLLRRPPVQLDVEGIKEVFKRRTILITGAGGSIGSELCRQLLRFQPERLILLDAGEANLYDIEMELRHQRKFNAYHGILAKVQDQSIMDDIFRTYRPHVVFHAAAYKHVPILERNPWEAIFNNVKGSQVAMETAAKYGVDRFVLVSTDKAVRPTNVMGTSKRLTELILHSLQRTSGTRFMAVRFGNVLASSGSVIPLFLKQIEHGGPVTVTHPEVTRYFMTIPEAAQLILQAGTLGEGGEIFVLEMGTPVKIADMATDLIRLSGKEPGRDIEVTFTGLRAGEKLYEELIGQGEEVARTRHEKIMVLKYNGHNRWNGLHSQDSFCSWLAPEIEALYRTAERHDAAAIKKKLKQIVPEYIPQETEGVPLA